MPVLVTGASGFLGSAVARILITKGYKVRVLMRESSNRENIAHLPVDIVKGDLNDTTSLKKAVTGCSALFHVAADYRLWVQNPDQMYRTNIDGSRNIILAAAQAGVRRIVYTSSVATLGLHPDGTPSDENSPATEDAMIGPYKRSKYLAEAEIQALITKQHLPVVIVNPSTPIGPRDIKPTPTGRMILEAARGNMPAYVDSGLNVVHVDDVANGHLLALEHGTIGQRYILGGQNMTLKDIFHELATITGKRPPAFKLPHNLVLPIAYIAECVGKILHKKDMLITVDGVRMAKKHMYFSCEKAERELGYTHRPVREALQDAVQWFQHHGYLQ